MLRNLDGRLARRPLHTRWPVWIARHLGPYHLRHDAGSGAAGCDASQLASSPPLRARIATGRWVLGAGGAVAVPPWLTRPGRPPASQTRGSTHTPRLSRYRRRSSTLLIACRRTVPGLHCLCPSSRSASGC
eukprot:scaffold160591_cov26-Tisochrysis_lutea.AAC.2